MERVRKAEKSPWTLKKSKPGPKKKNKTHFPDERKKSLAESDKGSWFDQLEETNENRTDSRFYAPTATSPPQTYHFERANYSKRVRRYIALCAERVRSNKWRHRP